MTNTIETEEQTKKCSKCQGNIPFDANKCRHCGADCNSNNEIVWFYTFVIFFIVLIISLIQMNSNKGNNSDVLPSVTSQQEKAATTSNCFFTSDKYCYFAKNADGNIPYDEALANCKEQGGDFPPKDDVEKYMNELGELYNGAPVTGVMPKIGYLWTRETKTAYGWVQSISTDYNNSNWAKLRSGILSDGNFNKRDYVAYACVRDR